MKSDNFTHLKDKYKEIWDSYVNHKFVNELREGTLSKESFKYYLIQDSKYVKEMMKALARAAGNSIDDKVNTFLMKILSSKDRGREVHEKLIKSIGITETEIEDSRFSLVNFAYTRHLLLSSRTWEEFVFAWTPCMVGYYEIGNIAKDTKIELYREWASFYASAEYGERVKLIIHELNSIKLNDYLESLFQNSVILETLFWDSALKMDPTLFR